METSARHLSATFASLLVVILAASGCGSSSKSAAASSAGGAGAATSTAAATTSAAAAAATSGSAATPAVAPPVSAAAITTVKATGGGTFCKNLAAFINSSTTDLTGTTPAAVKASVQKSQAETAILLSEAPSAIKTDLGTLFAATNTLYAALAKANYDFTKVGTTATDALSTPAVEAAETRSDAYVKTKCGIDVGASS